MSPFQQLSLADIDLEHFESRTLLFTLYIQNDTSITVTAKLNITLSIRLAEGTVLPNVVLITEEFKISSGVKNITNLNIGKNAEIKLEPFTLPTEVKEKIQDVAFATGKLPAGSYKFDFQLVVDQCGTIEPIETPPTIEVTNPSRVELQSPRDGEITNEFPLFEFFHEGSTGVITIAEKLPDQSREDAIIKKPPMVESPLTKDQNSFFYSGGRPLEQGKTYVWRVVSKIREVGGSENEISSPISLFKVSSSTMENLTPQKLPVDPILKILEDNLGNQYSAIFEQIRKDGFKTSGQYMLNGTVISRGELMKIINELRKIDNNIEVSFE